MRKPWLPAPAQTLRAATTPLTPRATLPAPTARLRPPTTPRTPPATLPAPAETLRAATTPRTPPATLPAPAETLRPAATPPSPPAAGPLAAAWLRAATAPLTSRSTPRPLTARLPAPNHPRLPRPGHRLPLPAACLRAAGRALLGLLLCAFGPPRLANHLSLPSFEAGPAELRAIHHTAPPSLTARSAAVVDFASGRLLFGQAEHLRLPPASTTKIMTALLTIEQGDLDAEIAVSALAAGQIGTRMGLAAGERFSARQLLFGLLLPSGNDAAVALAQRRGQTVPAFVDRMNARAAQLGMHDTHFMNPHGLDAPGHLSSAYDLALLARYALRSEPLFDRLVATAHDAIPAGPTHPALDLANLNQLLGSYPGADGVKTGTTPQAGQVLVASATRDYHRLLAVVMASADRYADARALLDYGFAHFRWLRPDLVLPFELPVQIRDTAGAVIPAWTAPQVQVYLDPDTMVGAFTLDRRELFTVPLADPYRLTRPPAPPSPDAG